MSKSYNHKIISTVISYTPDEIVNAMQKNKVTKNKVNTWIKNGLNTMCKSPTLISGKDLIGFLKKLNASNPKLDLQDDEFFCFSCKLPHIPLGRRISTIQNGKIIRAKGICPDTKKIMFRTYNIDHFCEIKKFFKLVEETRLYDSASPNEKEQETITTSASNSNTLFQ